MYCNNKQKDNVAVSLMNYDEPVMSKERFAVDDYKCMHQLGILIQQKVSVH